MSFCDAHCRSKIMGHKDREETLRWFCTIHGGWQTPVEPARCARCSCAILDPHQHGVRCQLYRPQTRRLA